MDRERELSTSTNGSTNLHRHPRMHGHGKKARVLPNGLELEALPSDISLFQSIRQIIQIQQKKVFHGEILEILIPAMTFSIRTMMSRSVQSRRQISFLRSSNWCTCSGSRTSSRLIARLLRILDCIADTAT